MNYYLKRIKSLALENSFCSIGLLIGGVLMVTAFAACEPPPRKLATTAKKRPASTLDWRSGGKGFLEWGAGGEYLFATTAEPYSIDIWKWSQSDLARYRQITSPNFGTEVNFIDGDKLILCSGGGARNPIFIGLFDTKTLRFEKKWELESGWWCTRIQVSRNGEYVGVVLGEEGGELGPSDADFDHPRTRVGIVGPKRDSMSIVGTIIGSSAAEDSLVRSALPSDDGHFVAVAGVGNKLAMIDVASEKCIWKQKPFNEASLDYVAFSPDSNTIYTGGTMGAVHSYDSAAGTYLNSWYASSSGKAEYGHRISCISASADGKWIAVGTGPEGLVFVGDTSLSRLVATLDHGRSTVVLVQFSPDSKALASFVPGTIKVWQTSLWDSSGGLSATSRPASQTSFSR